MRGNPSAHQSSALHHPGLGQPSSTATHRSHRRRSGAHGCVCSAQQRGLCRGTALVASHIEGSRGAVCRSSRVLKEAQPAVLVRAAAADGHTGDIKQLALGQHACRVGLDAAGGCVVGCACVTQGQPLAGHPTDTGGGVAGCRREGGECKGGQGVSTAGVAGTR